MAANCLEEYTFTNIKEEIHIKRIVTVHYFEYGKDYSFSGEKHDFWELLYVDKGEAKVMAETSNYILKQGEIIFHKPNEFHNIWSNGTIAPNLVVIAFDCKSKSMDFFKGRILNLSDKEKKYLAVIISEAKNAYNSPLDNPMLKKLEKSNHIKFGSEQILKIHLELMLISLIRQDKYGKVAEKLSTTVKQRSDEDLIHKIICFLEENVHDNISFNDVCHKFSQSKTNLKVLFKEKMNMGVMDYYRHLKIELAKKLIREETYNFTQISALLSYSTVHYFSRYFKKSTDMTPSEYANSVKAREEHES
jgi:AraC-like DNA-binding protein/mannose-6-phosphate isomerase-like protein (cupin superfamily)